MPSPEDNKTLRGTAISNTRHFERNKNDHEIKKL